MDCSVMGRIWMRGTAGACPSATKHIRAGNTCALKRLFAVGGRWATHVPFHVGKAWAATCRSQHDCKSSKQAGRAR